ncbi:MAG: hypothetical protein VB092_04870 [Oscillospiraceae bacterium]|nr:hypothetical protein [Oscillospiraceae bacterium]
MEALIFACAFLLGFAAGALFWILSSLRGGNAVRAADCRRDALEKQYAALLAYGAEPNKGEKHEN